MVKKNNNSAFYWNPKFRFTRNRVKRVAPVWPTEVHPPYIRLAPGNNVKLKWTVSLYKAPAQLPSGAPLW